MSAVGIGPEDQSSRPGRRGREVEERVSGGGSGESQSARNQERRALQSSKESKPSGSGENTDRTRGTPDIALVASTAQIVRP